MVRTNLESDCRLANEEGCFIAVAHTERPLHANPQTLKLGGWATVVQLTSS